MASLTTYKKTQGRPTRQVALCAVIASLSWLLISTVALFKAKLTSKLGDVAAWFQLDWRPGNVFWLVICVLVVAAAGVISILALNRPRWADFLISVQAEIDKVTWPSKGEVRKATMVVLVLLVSMAMVIFVFDVIWQKVFKTIGFLQI